MGKKSRKKAAKAADAERALKREERRSAIDRHGRMPVADAHKYLDMLGFLALAARDRAEEENQKIYGEPMGWPRDGRGMYTMVDTDAIGDMTNFILRNIGTISAEVDSGIHDELFRRCMGRRIGDADRDNIRLLQIHVEDDFVVVDHIPMKGTIFVQVGVPKEFAKLSERRNQTEYKDADIHEPRVFVVKGFHEPLAEVFHYQEETLAVHVPSIRKSYALPIAIVHATVVPFMGGLTYAINPKYPTEGYYPTPQQKTEAVRIAVEAYRVMSCKRLQSAGDNERIPLYEKFHQTDTSLIRSAYITKSDEFSHRYLDKAMDPNVTELCCLEESWGPWHNTKSTEAGLFCELFGVRPQRTIVSPGCRFQPRSTLLVHDDEPCPFHRRMGVGSAFAKCCKEKNMKLQARAQKKMGTMRSFVYYLSAPDKEELKWIMEDNRRDKGYTALLRIAVQDIFSATIEVSREDVEVVKRRMNVSFSFLDVGPPTSTNPSYSSEGKRKWKYLGSGGTPLITKYNTALYFGEVIMDDATGKLVGEAYTTESMRALTHEMRLICCNIRIKGTSVVTEKVAAQKPNMADLEMIGELLCKGLAKKATISVSKGKYNLCAYCGAREKEKPLLRCACKTAYYCSKEHQRLDRTNHKDVCHRNRK